MVQDTVWPSGVCQARRGFEPRSTDSESVVLTATPTSHPFRWCLQHAVENATHDSIPVCFLCLCFSSSTNFQTAENRSGRTSWSGGNWPHDVGKVVHLPPERVPYWQLGSTDEGKICCVLSRFANFVRWMRSFHKHLSCQLISNEQRWPSSTWNDWKLFLRIDETQRKVGHLATFRAPSCKAWGGIPGFTRIPRPKYWTRCRPHWLHCPHLYSWWCFTVEKYERCCEHRSRSECLPRTRRNQNTE